MNETHLACGACGAVFTDHESRLNPVDPDQDQAQCPKCGSTNIEPYAFDSDIPVADLNEDEDDGL